MALNPKQKRFCEEYIIDLNGTQAAIRAGYSKKTAGVQCCDLLKKPSIQAEVNRLKLACSKRTEITADRVLRETYLLAMSDFAEAFDDQGALKPVKEIPEHLRRAMSSVEIEKLFEWNAEHEKEHVGYTQKVKFWDKVKALELLGKHLKLFSEKVEHSGEISINVTTGVPHADRH